MPQSKNKPAQRGGAKGNFTDKRNGLLALFTDPDGRGERSWQEVFGYERRPVKAERGEPFIARGARKSSSDSK